MSKNMAIIDDTGTVLNVIICEDDKPEEPNLIAYTNENPAYIGGDYVDGYFYSPQPYLSWIRFNGTWQSPTPMPTDGKAYRWDEPTLSWVEREKLN